MYKPKNRYVAASYTQTVFRIKGEDPAVPVWNQGFRMNILFDVQKDDGTIVKSETFYYSGVKEGSDAVVTVDVPSEWYGKPVVGFGIWAIVNPNYPYWGIEPSWSSAHGMVVEDVPIETRGWYKGTPPSTMTLKLAPVLTPTRIVIVRNTSGQTIAGASLSGTYQGGSGTHPCGPWISDSQGRFNIYAEGDFNGVFASWTVSASGYDTKSGSGNITEIVTLTGSGGGGGGGGGGETPPPPPTYTITVNQSPHGTILPGTSTVTEGGSKTFSVTPHTGYYVANVIVDGESKGAVSSWTFSNVQENHVLTATFASDVSPPDSFTITVSQSENGVISPGTTTVAENEDAHFAITPDEGYVVEDVLVDGEPQGAISSYTFYNVASNHNLSATFKKTSVPSTPNYVPAVAVGIGLVCSALIIRKLI